MGHTKIVVKIFCFLTSLIFFLVISLIIPDRALAFEFAGMKGRGDGPHNTGGKPSDVSWPEVFLKEVEAAQAQAVLEASQYENWYLDRSIMGNFYEPLSDGKQKPRQVFWGEDQLVPASIKCANSDAKKILVYSQHIDRSFQRQEKSWFGEKNLVGEYVAIISGFGWNCEGLTREVYWSGQEEKEYYASDDSYIQEFARKAKDIKPVPLSLDEDENYYFDASTGIYWDKYAAPRRKFVMENCNCIDQPDEGEEK